MLLSTVKRPTGAISNFHFIQQSHDGPTNLPRPLAAKAASQLARAAGP